MAFDPIRIDVRNDAEPVERVHVIEKQPILLTTRIEERQRSNEPADSNEKPADSKKEFEIETKSKKEFEPEPADSNGPVFDRDGNEGRWRPNELVRSLVIYRWEFKHWPDDLEDKNNHPTGIESYYELRYFSEGTNRRGERYAELYKEHRARRDLWIDEECQRRALKNPGPVGLSADESNVVHLPTRRASSSN